MLLDQDTFTLIGVEEGEELADVGLGGPGNIGAFDEVLYAAADPDDPDSWETRGRVGVLNAIYVLTPSGRAVVNLAMRFDDGDQHTLTATGSLEYDASSDKPGVRRGAMSITGGTGRFKGRGGEIHVEHRNPHKYSVTR